MAELRRDLQPSPPPTPAAPRRRLVGAVLAQAKADSALLADAHAVAVAVEAGGGVVLTADPDDVSRLAEPYRCGR
jgi:predicted nucleic acid-binding protein